MRKLVFSLLAAGLLCLPVTARGEAGAIEESSNWWATVVNWVLEVTGIEFKSTNPAPTQNPPPITSPGDDDPMIGASTIIDPYG